MRAFLVAALLSMSCATLTPEEQIVAACVGAGTCAIPVIAVGGAWLALPDGKVPGYGTLQKDSPYPGEHVARALDLFLIKWEQRFGQSILVRNALDRFDIIWEERAFFEMRDHSKNAGFVEKMGSTDLFYRGEIKVAWQPGVHLWSTALAHEFAHVALAVTTKDYDRNHEEPPGPWTKDVDALIAEVNAALRAEMETRP